MGMRHALGGALIWFTICLFTTLVFHLCGMAVGHKTTLLKSFAIGIIMASVLLSVTLLFSLADWLLR
jgi:ABC-type transport system involved in cytochrome c biogenesis permease component